MYFTVIEAQEKCLFSKFLKWIDEVTFISREADNICAAFAVEILMESELIDNITHWPKGSTDICTNCKVDHTLKQDLQKVAWKSLQVQPPANVVRVVLTSKYCMFILCSLLE